MSELLAGESVTDFTLPNLDGRDFRLSSLAGRRYHLAFFRFASCPFCNLRVNALVRAIRDGNFGVIDEDVAIVAVFDSPLDNLKRFAGRHDAPFPILADEGGVVHEEWGRKISWGGVLRGMFGRFGTLMKAMVGQGYLPLSLKGKFAGMPMDFLVDENGIIREACYGADEGDHMAMERIEEFFQTG